MRVAWLLGRLGWLRILFPCLIVQFPLVVTVLRWLRLLGVGDPIVILVIPVSLPSAVVGVGNSVAGGIEIVLDYFCRVCVTSLPESGLGCGYDLAYSNV